MIKHVPLANSERYAVIDAADWELVSHYKWRLMDNGTSQYAGTGSCTRLMHRIILGAKKGQLVDHKDGDGLNNQRHNIRIATSLGNALNRKIPNRNNRTGLIGVRLDPRYPGRWAVRVCDQGRLVHVGTFGSAEEAAAVRREAELLLYGEYAHKRPDNYRSRFDSIKELLNHYYHATVRAKSGHRYIEQRPDGKWVARADRRTWVGSFDSLELALKAQAAAWAKS